MALQHRAAKCGRSAWRSPLAHRLSVLAACFGCAASTAQAQSYDFPNQNREKRTTVLSLQDRLRLFNRQKSRRGRPTSRTAFPTGYANPIPRDPAGTPDLGQPLRGEPIAGWSESRTPTVRPRVDWGDRMPERAMLPPGNDVIPTGGHSLATANPTQHSVYHPTRNPEEVVRQPGEMTETVAQIPEVVPRDILPDPNLLPPPAEQAEVSTWQRYRQQWPHERSVFLQSTFSRGTWLIGGTNKVGMYDVYTQGTLQFRSLPGFAFTPYFQAYFLDGPQRTDLPARLYLVAGEFRQFVPVGESLVLDLWVAPGVFSDFEANNSDAFRVQAKAVGVYQWSPFSQFLLGFLYLDRDDVRVLPVVGWIYIPNAELRLELVFPRPKLAIRLSQRANYSRWGYIAGEFGGDSWAIQRRTGATDTLVYRDLRLIFGFEQRYANGRSFLLEVGYVFNRKVEYGSGAGDFDPGSTSMLRAGLTY